jgi:3-hydroxyisobutyrate dehydrogenase-like beta-hydroxyacid dehydrogenase
MRIGFIGLGNLGAPIAENLLDKGHELYVYNRTASKAQPLANKGALICTSVKELSTICDIVFSVVADDAALNHITQGKEGIAANLKASGIHASISTVLPSTSEHLSGIHQQHNNHYIACPVMGRPEAVRARKLNFIVAGDHSSVELIKPFLQDAGAAGIWEFGENVSHANVAKLCSNFLIASAIEALAEGINLTKKSGMDAQPWINMLTQTIFNSSVYINYGNIILKEAYQPPAFSLRLGLKDINLVMEQAAETNAQMIFGKALQERMHQCVANGLGEYDWTAIALALKEKSVA